MLLSFLKGLVPFDMPCNSNTRSRSGPAIPIAGRIYDLRNIYFFFFFFFSFFFSFFVIPPPELKLTTLLRQNTCRLWM